MNSLILDCEFGVSGDMLVGALLNLGVSEQNLIDKLNSLNLNDFKIEITKVEKNNVIATDFNVVLNNNFDHDMNYLFGDKKANYFDVDKKRNLYDVKKIINSSSLSDNAKLVANNIFDIVADAEAKAHKIELNQVNFHETGAMDSIIDIVSVAVCLDELKVKKVYVKNLREGYGFVNTRVGKLPIPTPAVKNISDRFNIRLVSANINAELITPTGLGSLAAISSFEAKPINYKVLKVGYGAGKRKYNTPCTLKAMLII